jgi:hypothetical protein
MKRFVCSLAILACFASAAVADLAPPPPRQGLKRVPYEHVLKLAEEIPGYKFYTFQRLGIGGQEKIGDELKLDTKTGVKVPSTSSPSVRTGVVAVPDKVMDELKTKENLAKLLARDNKDKLPAGVVIHETRGTIQDVKENDPRTKVENIISISVDDKAGVKFSAGEAAAPTGKKGAAIEPSPRPPYASLIASLAATLAVVTLGFWFIRRK